MSLPSEIENKLISTWNRPQPFVKWKITENTEMVNPKRRSLLGNSSTTIRPAVKIFFASILVITSYLYLLGVTEKFNLNMPAIGNWSPKHYHQQANCIFPERRQVINGIMCDVQRKQINVFMASFFGGFFAADQWYAVRQQPHLNYSMSTEPSLSVTFNSRYPNSSFSSQDLEVFWDFFLEFLRW